MDKESLELQQKILDKLQEWRTSPEFGASKYDMQKYKRAKGMLQATHPKVLTEVLGITSVRDVPKESMNQIRTMDLGTLKNLEIFRGMDDKIVGHHMSAFGAISGILDNQSPERRLELLNRAIDQGYVTGMDPSGIGPIRTSIHKPIAHEGDFSGKKPGYQTKVFTNDDDIEDVWSAFESSLKQQQGSFYKAREHQSTQDLISASKGAFGEDLITSLETPMEERQLASKAGDAIAPEVDKIITEFSGNDEAIQNAINPLASKLPKFRLVNGVARFVPGVADNLALAGVVGLGVGGATLLGGGGVKAAGKNALTAAKDIATADIQDVKTSITTDRTNNLATTQRDLQGLAGLTGLASMIPGINLAGGVASATFGAASMLVGNRIQRDETKERRQESLANPSYVNPDDQHVLTKTDKSFKSGRY